MGRPESRDDPALIKLVRLGDLDAVMTLYDRHAAALYFVALALTGRPSAAEAAVVKGFQIAATSDDDGRTCAWQVLARATLAACRTVDRPPP